MSLDAAHGDLTVPYLAVKRSRPLCVRVLRRSSLRLANHRRLVDLGLRDAGRSVHVRLDARSPKLGWSCDAPRLPERFAVVVRTALRVRLCGRHWSDFGRAATTCTASTPPNLTTPIPATPPAWSASTASSGRTSTRRLSARALSSLARSHLCMPRPRFAVRCL